MPDEHGFYSATEEKKRQLRPLEKDFRKDPDGAPSGARFVDLLNRLGAAYYAHWRAGESRTFHFQSDGAAWDVRRTFTETRAQFNRLQAGIYHWQELRKVTEREKRGPLDPKDEADVSLIERRNIATKFFADNPDIVIE